VERTEAIEKLKKLVGKELHELARKYGVTVYQGGKVNKGWAGHVFERYLEIPINSAQSPNFGSWELKSIPLKYKKTGELTFKETMAITMIDPVNVCQKTFKESHLFTFPPQCYGFQPVDEVIRQRRTGEACCGKCHGF